MANSFMLQGTGSDVGKTVLVAGLCRLAKNRGFKVRPFKPQNMSNNAAVTPDGGEIGRAQWLQALACGVVPSVHMNPVLLKPQSSFGSQIIVQGKVFGQAKGRDYQKLKPQLLDAVLQSYQTVSTDADLVIVEGAGSPAEINLRAGDIANMGFADAADVPVVLVGDIDRGGVIASLVGTHTILPANDRARIAGYIINKFRGDVTLFDDGLTAIDEFTRWPCFGVVPWLEAVGKLPAEDSVILERLGVSPRQDGIKHGGFKIVVPVLDRIANFDDLAPLQAEFDVLFVKSGERLPQADLVILPGSKSTISDLKRLRENGWDADLAKHVASGGYVLGICGGYQMLGQRINDPESIEGNDIEAQGLGFLNIETTLKPEKRLALTDAVHVASGEVVSGYEIHLGESVGEARVRPFAQIAGAPEGACSADGKIFGTYLHGLFENDGFRAQFLSSLGAQTDGMQSDYRKSVENALDELASELENRLDINALFNL